MITPKQASDFVTRLREIARDAKKLNTGLNAGNPSNMTKLIKVT